MCIHTCRHTHAHTGIRVGKNSMIIILNQTSQKSRKHTGGETAWEVSPEGPIFLFRRKIHDFDDCDLETFRSQRSHHLVSNFASALWFDGGSFHVQEGELFKQCSRFERLPGPMRTPSGLPRNHTLFPLDKR